MKYAHLYTGTDGKAYFKDVEVPSKQTRPGEKTSETIKATGIFFRETSEGYDLDYHNPTKRQFVITLEGQSEVIASGGEKRTFKAGDIMLADDMKGKGHMSRAIPGKPRKAIFVTLE